MLHSNHYNYETESESDYRVLLIDRESLLIDHMFPFDERDTSRLSFAHSFNTTANKTLTEASFSKEKCVCTLSKQMTIYFSNGINPPTLNQKHLK